MNIPTSISRWKKTPPWAVGLIALVLAFDLAFFWQHAADAYHSEFGGHPEEAVHVVGGLFARDAIGAAFEYATDGFHGSAIAFSRQYAEEYDQHYPMVGYGAGSPVFHLVQAAWTLPLGASSRNLLLLMAVLAAGVAVLVFRGLREEYGLPAGGLGMLLVLCLPLVRTHYGMVMAETLSALCMLGAVLAFGEFLDRERRSDALWFGVLAALAILTDGTGLALGLAAPFALLWTRRFHLLKRPALWSAVLIMVLVAGSWTWATRRAGIGGGLLPSPSWGFTSEALPYYARKFGFALGWAALPFLAIGFATKLRPRAEHPGRWAACGALIPAVVIFQSIAPAGLEARHLIPALPPACLFAVAGLCFVDTRWWQKRAGGIPAPADISPRRVGAIFWLGAVVLLILPCTTAPRASKGCYGFAIPADHVVAQAAPAEVTLVSSDATGEGMFIAEVALREPRPGHVILRASQALATGPTKGGGDSLRFGNDEDLLAFLIKGDIRYLVVDDSIPPAERRVYHDQLARVIAAHPARFFPLSDTDSSRAGEVQSEAIHFYQIKN